MRETSSNLKPIHLSKDIRGGDKKVMKKILSVALSTAMAFSMFASVAFADEAKLDTQGKYDFLKEKGVFNGNPDGSAALDKEMTRAEFAKVITKLYGLEEITGVLTYKDKNYKEGVWFVPFIEAVTKAGYMEGKDKEKMLFDPNGKVTVEELAKVLVLALKLEVPTDADNSASPWAKGYVAAAVKAGLLTGNENFKGNALRGLLVDNAYIAYQAIEAAKVKVESYEIVDSKNVNVTFSDKEVEKVALTTALEVGKETEIKVTHKGQEYAVKVTLAAFQAESAKTDNFAEVDVTFNRAVDADSLNKDNFLVNKVALGSKDTLTVLEDGKTVRIFKYDGFVAESQQNTAKKIAVSGVKSKDGVAMAAFEQDVTFKDLAFPELKSVSAVGNKRIVLTFSEPVKDVADTKIFSNYKVDGAYLVGSGTPEVSGRTVTIDLASALSVGEHKVSVVSNKIKDYAGFASVPSDVAFTVAEDKVAATVELVSASPEKVTIKYSKEIKSASVYWMNGSTKNTASSVEVDSADKTKVTYIFDNSFGHAYLPLTQTKVFVENATDFFGNVSSKAEFQVTATPDTARPVAVSAESSKEGEIIVKFDKDVFVPGTNYPGTSTAAGGTITVKNKDGANVAVTKAVGANAKEIKLSGLITDLSPGNGPYIVTVDKVEDKSSLRNQSLTYAFTVSVPDKIAPSITSVTYAAGTNGTIAVKFSEAVDPSTALDSNNYAYLENGVGYVGLPTTASYELLPDGQTVIITIPGNAWTYNNQARTVLNLTAANAISIRNIKDKAGNTMVAALYNATAQTESAPVFTVANASGKNQIKIPVTGTMPATVYAGDFEVYAAAGPNVAADKQLTITGISVDGSNLVLNVYETLQADGQYKVSDTVTRNVYVKAKTTIAGTKTATGLPISGITSVGLVDNIGPTANQNVIVNAGTVTVTFDEAVALDTTVLADPTALALALTVKDGDGQLVANSQYTAAINGAGQLVITFPGTYSKAITEISLPGFGLKDGAGNKNNAFNVNTNGVTVR